MSTTRWRWAIATAGLLGSAAMETMCVGAPDPVVAAPAAVHDWSTWLSSGEGDPSDADVDRMRESGEAGARELIMSLRPGYGSELRRCFLILFRAGEATARVAREFALRSADRDADRVWSAWRNVLEEQARDFRSRSSRALAVRELTWDLRVRPSSYGPDKFGDLKLPFSGAGHVSESDIGEFLSVVGPWLRTLRSEEADFRRTCRNVLRELAQTRIDAWNTIVGLLEDSDATVRADAVDWLWVRRVDGPEMWQDVERLGRSDDARVALTCAGILVREKRGVPAALRERITTEILRSSSPSDSRVLAIEVASGTGELTPDEVSALVTMCRSSEPVVSRAAVGALVHARVDSEAVRALLLEIAMNPRANRSERISASSGLVSRWPFSNEVRRALLQTSSSDDPVVLAFARRDLAEYAPLHDEEVASRLCDSIANADVGELTLLARILRTRGELPPVLARAVRSRIEAGDPKAEELLVPLLAWAGLASLADLHHLSKVSPKPSEAIVETMFSMVEAVPTADLLATAGWGIPPYFFGRMLESDALPPRVRDGLPGLLRHHDIDVRLGAAEVCGRWPVREGRTVSSLRDLLGDPSAVVRSAAASGLWMSGDHSSSLIAGIARGLDDRDARASSIRRLGAIGPAAGEFAPRLAGFVESGDGIEIRLAACAAISALRVRNPAVVAALVRSLRAGHTPPEGWEYPVEESLEEAVARTLAAMGPCARSAIPELIRIAEDRMSSVLPGSMAIRARCQALRALGEIGGLDKAQISTVRALSTSSQVREVRRVAAEVLRRLE